MEKILIMMSTFNGEKFIAEQLDSIFSQEKVTVYLLVRDDGSTDNTVSILKDYLKKHPDSMCLIEGKNLGWRKSFFSLIDHAFHHYSSFRYYAFSDQDDIWLPSKLSNAVSKIETLPEGARLYCSNLIYYKNGNRYGNIRKNGIIPTFKNCLIRNYATGCTIVFNDSLIAALAKGQPDLVIAHDYWCYMVAMLLGSVYIDDEAYILYRQHDSNQIGSKPGLLNQWKRRLHSLSELIGNHNRERLSNELLRIYGKCMAHEPLKAVNKIAQYRSSLRNRFSLLIDNGYSFDKVDNDFWLKVRILAGRL